MTRIVTLATFILVAPVLISCVANGALVHP